MSAADREVQCPQIDRERARRASMPGDGRDLAAEAADLADRLDAYAAAVGDLAGALADELAEQES
jgi:hypothetical protein